MFLIIRNILLPLTCYGFRLFRDVVALARQMFSVSRHRGILSCIGNFYLNVSIFLFTGLIYSVLHTHTHTHTCVCVCVYHWGFQLSIHPE